MLIANLKVKPACKVFFNEYNWYITHIWNATVCHSYNFTSGGAGDLMLYYGISMLLLLNYSLRVTKVRKYKYKIILAVLGVWCNIPITWLWRVIQIWNGPTPIIITYSINIFPDTVNFSPCDTEILSDDTADEREKQS